MPYLLPLSGICKIRRLSFITFILNRNIKSFFSTHWSGLKKFNITSQVNMV